MAKSIPVPETEEWRAIPGRPDYQASSMGRIRSLDRVVLHKEGKHVRHHGRVLKAKPGGTSPYLTVHLRAEGRENFSSQLVHSLVCKTFHGPRPSKGHVVAHYDGNPLNNRANNLRWATRVDNMADQLRHGTRIFGSKNHQAIFCEEDVRAIRAMHATGRFTQQAIAALFDTDRANISLIVNRVNWPHLR